MLLCLVAIEAVEIESMEAPTEAWHNREAETVLREDMNGSKHRGDEG